MFRRSVIVLGVLLLASFLVKTWFAYYPQSGMFQTIGIAGPRANSGRTCGGWYRNTAIGRIQTRDITCRGREVYNGSSRYQEEVNIDRLTRKLVDAHVLWVRPDSVGSGIREDSIARAMVAHGGREIRCFQSPYAAQLGQRRTRDWKFADYSVRLYAARWYPPPAVKADWTEQLTGYPGLPNECVHDPWSHARSVLPN